VNNFNRDNMLEIEQKWMKITRAVRLTVKLIQLGYSCKPDF